MSKLEISKSGNEAPAAAIFESKVNVKFLEDVQDGENLCKYLDALWEEVSGNKLVFAHIHLAIVIIRGMNKTGMQFYPSIKKSKLPESKIKYYVNLLLKEDKQEDYKKALSKKETIEIDEDDLDSRVMNLTEESIANIKKCSVHKIRNMKSLNDNDFASMVAGSDEPYQNVDKNKQTKDELEISKLDFSKEHNIDLNVINKQLKDVKDDPLNYARKLLEVSELKAELKRVERLCVDLMKDQMEEPKLVNINDQTDPKPYYYLTGNKMVRVSKKELSVAD